MMFDEIKSAKASTAMWLKVGRALSALAVDRAQRGQETLAVRTAQAAEVAFWQATGQGDFGGLERFLAREPSA